MNNKLQTLLSCNQTAFCKWQSEFKQTQNTFENDQTTKKQNRKNP